MTLNKIIENGSKAFNFWKEYPIIFMEKEKKDGIKYVGHETVGDAAKNVFNEHHLKSLGISVLEGFAYAGIVYSLLPEEGVMHYLQHPGLFFARGCYNDHIKKFAII